MDQLRQDSAVTVGVIGMGRIGFPIARHLARSGFTVVGYDPAAERDQLDAEGIGYATSEVDVLARSEIVLLVVGFDEEVVQMIASPEFLSHCRPDHVIAVLSTVTPQSMIRIREILPAATGIVDAPLTRGQVAAEEGRLLGLVGGESSDVERCTPVLRAFCSDVVHVGDVGSGQVLKMANNMMLWSAYFGVFEGLRLLRAHNIDIDTAMEALRVSSAKSFALDLWPRVLPVWATDDLRIAIQDAASFEVEVPVTQAVATAFEVWPNPEVWFASESGTNQD